MKTKKDYRILIIIVLIAILGVIIYIYNINESSQVEEKYAIDTASNSSSNKNNVASTSEVQVEKKTIENTISCSGEIQTGLSEKISLHATYYFSEIYYDVGDTIKAGENILKYANGTYLTAPYNLVIASINVPNSGLQCTNSHYIEVNSIDTLNMELSVSEDNLSKVSVGQEVSIVPTIDSSKTYKGYVISVGNSGTYSSKGTTYSVKISFQNDSALKVGMSAKADIVLERAEDAIVVPNEAIQTSNGVKYVTIVENENTSQVTVETGMSNNAYTEIKSGVNEGETIQITKTDTSNTSYNFRGEIQTNPRDEDMGAPVEPARESMEKQVDKNL